MRTRRIIQWVVFFPAVAILAALLTGCTDESPTAPVLPEDALHAAQGWAQNWPTGPQDLKWPFVNGIPCRIINGYNSGGYHVDCRQYAVDLVHGTNQGATDGTWIVAAGRGIVHRVGYDDTRGNYVVLYHGQTNGRKLYTEYVHMKCIPPIRVGDDLLGGTYLGKIGRTGAYGGTPHLHFVVEEYDTTPCAPKYDHRRSIRMNGIDGDWNLLVNGVYWSSNVYIQAPGGYLPNSCTQ